MCAVRSHELTIMDGSVTWRIVYADEGDAIVILEALSEDSAVWG